LCFLILKKENKFVHKYYKKKAKIRIQSKMLHYGTEQSSLCSGTQHAQHEKNI